MAKYIISEQAKKDLVCIWHYTLETWSEEQAIRYYNELLDGCKRIVLILHGKMNYPKTIKIVH